MYSAMVWLSFISLWFIWGNEYLLTQLENFPDYRTQRFIAVFTSAFHYSLFWARQSLSTASLPIAVRSVLMVSSYYT
jgi:hypothetical protein